MMYYGNGMSGWGYAFMGIGTVLFWVLVVFGVVALVRYLVRTGQYSGGVTTARPSPQQLLDERFARGEIDTEEYQHRSEVLRAGGSTPAEPGSQQVGQASDWIR
jgi:putative membrane protein